MPYREPHDPPVRSWTLTSAARWRFVGAASVVLLLVGPALVASAAGGQPLATWIEAIALAAAPGLLLLTVWAWGGDGYRVHGGRGQMHLFRDRLEIPGARSARIDVLPLAGLEARTVVVRSRVDGVRVHETTMLELASGNVRRTLAHPLVGSDAQLLRIADDVMRARRGEPLTRDEPPSEKPAAPRDALDDRLDRELAKLD